MVRGSQIVAGILLLPYVACGVVLCLLVLDRKHCPSPYYILSDGPPTMAISTSTTPQLSTTTNTAPTTIIISKETTTTTKPPTTTPTTTLAATPRPTPPTPRTTTRGNTPPNRRPGGQNVPAGNTQPNPNKPAAKPGGQNVPAGNTQSNQNRAPNPNRAPTPKPIRPAVRSTKPASLLAVISSNTSEHNFRNDYCISGFHGFWSLMGTLVMGLAIILFRLLADNRRIIVKSIHVLFHVVTMALFIIGLWCIFSQDNASTHDRKGYHALTSWLAFILFCAQSVIAISEARQSLSFFHDLIGIWIFIVCVACCTSGKRRAQHDYVGHNQEFYYGLSHICFAFILIVLISPFFEWEMVESSL